MELLREVGPFTKTLVEQGVFKRDPLRYLDIGCSGGIPSELRAFGQPGLLALGIDPNVFEISRLARSEKTPGIRYQAAFVGPPDLFGAVPAPGTTTSGNPWSRLSASVKQEELARSTQSKAELTRQNNWHSVQLVDETQVFALDTIVADSHLGHVDLLKVDVDGSDLAVLRSGTAVLSDPRTLCVAVEVNYYGGAGDDENTFHNIDRLLRQMGFDLFGLTTRHYSSTALPSPFLLDIPAQTRSGRIYQGDAIYFRDLIAGDKGRAFAVLPETSVLKLASLFESFGLPDCAAEVIVAGGLGSPPLPASSSLALLKASQSRFESGQFHQARLRRNRTLAGKIHYALRSLRRRM